jgi:ribosomal protein L10
MNSRKVNKNKISMASNLENIISNGKNCVLVCNNIDASSIEMDKIRSQVRPFGKMLICKNTLAKRVFNSLDFKVDLNCLKNKSVLILSDNILSSIGGFNNIHKDLKKTLTPMAAFDLNGEIEINDNQMKKLSKFPSKEMLIANLSMMMKMPLMRMAKLLSVLSENKQ